MRGLGAFFLLKLKTIETYYRRLYACHNGWILWPVFGVKRSCSEIQLSTIHAKNTQDLFLRVDLELSSRNKGQ